MFQQKYKICIRCTFATRKKLFENCGTAATFGESFEDSRSMPEFTEIVRLSDISIVTLNKY